MVSRFALVFASVLMVALWSDQHQVNGLENGLARTPPMGWLTWQRFRCITDCVLFPNDCISEQLIRRTALKMVDDGYLDAGYEYIIVDDCWSEKSRDIDTQRLVPDQKRFPRGMKHLSDFVHSLGLKFGIYQDYGTKTCGGYPGIIGYEAIDAQTFADWGVDYVKLDGCYADYKTMDEGYPNFGNLLNDTGRPMVYSCSWPVYQEEAGQLPDFTRIQKYCNLWRNWDDIDDSWESMKGIVRYFAGNQTRIQPNAGPGHWNDPDMLLIGNFGLTIDQSQSQMALWAIMAAPLIMSTDLDRIRPEFRNILLNRDVIEINQDPLGVQGLRVLVKNDIEIWIRPLYTPKKNRRNFAIAFVSLRTDGAPYPLTINLSEINGLVHKAGYLQIDLFNTYQHARVLTTDLPFTVIVNPSGCRMYKLIAI